MNICDVKDPGFATNQFEKPPRRASKRKNNRVECVCGRMNKSTDAQCRCGALIVRRKVSR